MTKSLVALLIALASAGASGCAHANATTAAPLPPLDVPPAPPRVVATAATEARAREIASGIRVDAAPDRVAADGPRDLGRREGWHVSYRLSVPTQISLTLETTNGGISVSDVDGRIDFRTVNGGVKLSGLAGEVTDARIAGQVILASTKCELHRAWKQLVPDSGTLLWMGGTEEALGKRLVELREAGFADLTQVQIHVRPLPDGTGFTPSPDFLRRTGRELREHEILFQTLPWGSTDAALYWTLMDLGAASFATDHPEVTLKAVRDYYEQKR